ncbi:hypothetical protein, partial [Flagellimonas alvinocaridis]|uniref:hypothetical protein n=1 Tax=Flagellimonas alvinocaridis TaxID=2530200 RepID=UPI001F3246FB
MSEGEGSVNIPGGPPRPPPGVQPDDPIDRRTLRDFMQPPRQNRSSYLDLPAPANPNNAFVVKTGMISQLPTFHGVDSENPYAHISDFDGICALFDDTRVSPDVIRLKLFQFSL